jgi:hypothetical protein
MGHVPIAARMCHLNVAPELSYPVMDRVVEFKAGHDAAGIGLFN